MVNFQKSKSNPDGLGNIRYVTDNTGTFLHNYSYDPYGNEISSSPISNYGFQGYEKDRENNLSYLRARYYDPTIGRFISPDYLWGTLQDPMSQNKYAYAGNNPINLNDPLGLAYANVGVAGGIYGVNVGMGVMVDDKAGVYPYAGIGVGAPGVGLAATYSSGDVSIGWSGNVSGSFGIAGSYGTDRNLEVGVGSVGGGAMAQYTFGNIACRR